MTCDRERLIDLRRRERRLWRVANDARLRVDACRSEVAAAEAALEHQQRGRRGTAPRHFVRAVEEAQAELAEAQGDYAAAAERSRAATALLSACEARLAELGINADASAWLPGDGELVNVEESATC